jgi:putative tryptophan/tyrosine transport system substrate-binding protein
MRRREFISFVGGAMVTSPFPARAEQQSLPVIGFISSRSMEVDASLVAAFHEGLAQFGFVEGRNVASNTVGRTGDMISFQCSQPSS